MRCCALNTAALVSAQRAERTSKKILDSHAERCAFSVMVQKGVMSYLFFCTKEHSFVPLPFSLRGWPLCKRMEKRGSAVTKFDPLLPLYLRHRMFLICELLQVANPACAVLTLAVLT